MHASAAGAADLRPMPSDADAEDADGSAIVNQPSDVVQTNRTEMVAARVWTSGRLRDVLDVEFG